MVEDIEKWEVSPVLWLVTKLRHQKMANKTVLSQKLE